MASPTRYYKTDISNLEQYHRLYNCYFLTLIINIKLHIPAVKDRLNPSGVPKLTSFDMKFKYMSDPVDSIGNGRTRRNELNARPPISVSNRVGPSCTFSTSSLYKNNLHRS